ncbi:MAG: hypothetical protein ABSA39_08190 [Edaphobacter sp.]
MAKKSFTPLFSLQIPGFSVNDVETASWIWNCIVVCRWFVFGLGKARCIRKESAKSSKTLALPYASPAIRHWDENYLHPSIEKILTAVVPVM